MNCSCRDNWISDLSFPCCAFSTDAHGVISGLSVPLASVLGYTSAEVVGYYAATLFVDPDELADRSEELSRLFGRQVTGSEALLAVALLDGKEIRNWTLRGKSQASLPARLHVVAGQSAIAASADYWVYVEFSHVSDPLDAAEVLSFPDKRLQQLLTESLQHAYDPVNAMIGYASLMEMEPSIAGHAQHLKQIQNEGRRLLEFLHRSVELAQMISGFSPVDHQPVSVSECLDEIVSGICRREPGDGVRIAWKLESDLDVLIQTDKHLLSRLLETLILISMEKAIQGTVDIQASILSDPTERTSGKLTIAVYDAGLPTLYGKDRQLHFRYVQVCAGALGGSVYWTPPIEFRRTGLRCTVLLPGLQLISPNTPEVDLSQPSQVSYLTATN